MAFTRPSRPWARALSGRKGSIKRGNGSRSRFSEAGLEVYDQPLSIVIPRTRENRIETMDVTSGAWKPLPQVSVYPFFPNHAQPVVTPSGGLEGKLVLLNEEILETAMAFDQAIGVIDAGDEGFVHNQGYDWKRLAALGLRALIVTHRESWGDVEWSRVADRNAGMVASVPVNYVRLAATPEILNHVGAKVRLHVRVHFERAASRNVIGVLKAAEPSREALIVTAPYDALSILPDVAPGTLSAWAPAIQQSLLEGLLPYRDTLKRDVFFVALAGQAMGNAGLVEFLKVLQVNQRDLSGGSGESVSEEGEPAGRSRARYIQRCAALEREGSRHRNRLAHVDDLLRLFDWPDFLVSRRETLQALEGLEPAGRRFLEDQHRILVDQEISIRAEPLLQAKVAFKEAGTDPRSPEFRRFRESRVRYDDMVALSGYSLASFLGLERAVARQFGLRERMGERLQELAEYHRRQLAKVRQEESLVEALRPYNYVGMVEVALAPAQEESERIESLSFDSSAPARYSQYELWRLLRESRLGLEIPADYLSLPPVQRFQSAEVRLNVDRNYVPNGFIQQMNRAGFTAYSFLNFGRRASYTVLGYPVERPFMSEVESIRHSLAVTGDAILALAHGEGSFISGSGSTDMKDYSGRVLVSNVGNSLVPDFPLADAIVMARSRNGEADYSYAGFYKHTLTMTDAYGEFRLPEHAGDFVNYGLFSSQGRAFTPIAVGYGEDGLISYMKDEGPATQRLFKSILIPANTALDVDDITVVLFRAAPVCVVDLVNPQSLKDFSSVQLISAQGMAEFPKFCRFRNPGIEITFVEPDRDFYVELQSGAPENELVQMTRAFMTGLTREEFDPLMPDAVRAKDEEIAGRGYRPLGNGILPNVSTEIGRSMAYVNAQRLAIQDRYRMADAQTRKYHQTTLGKLAQSENQALPRSEARKAAREAVTYAMLTHPAVRESVFEAVAGILWYLFLLVPFLFFFEKLVFGFSDLRRQLVVQAVVFVVVFSLLRFLHPAFHMVRSSLMILLGFVILFISAGITVLFTGKFRENLEEMRRRRGQVRGAEVNALGVMMTAFMLGLNNMHRRRMRTGLTCATLVFLVFTLIAFSSVQTDVVEEDIAAGKAGYQGLLIKRERFRHITEGELTAIRERFSSLFDVCPRWLLLGQERSDDRMRFNPELRIARREGPVERSVDFESVLRCMPFDPLVTQVKLEAGAFPSAIEGETVPAILVPDRIADELGLSRHQIAREPAPVTVNGQTCKVTGIFDGESLESLVDLDGMDLLPFDIESMPEVVIEGGRALAEDDAPRIPAQSLIISNLGVGSVPFAHESIHSVAVSMEGVAYPQAKRAIDEFLEQSRQPTFYGLDGIAFQGTRSRGASADGAIDLLIPLIIAAVTVLNTMRGSVYERRDEIYIYNSVGIAPRYVFFMFFAEAFVYSVIGSVLGYLLSQGAGRFLTEMGWHGGLDMTFTSLTTVYASWALIGATFASTFFPARTAMELAAPAEDAGWTLPEPHGDAIHLNLPFTFSKRESLAVLEFMDRFLQDHGEGGAGRFFAGLPEVGVQEFEEGRATRLVPVLKADLWLKPYDLGVSERLHLALCPDSESKMIQAVVTLSRQSGTRQAWVRLNHGFVAGARPSGGNN